MTKMKIEEIKNATINLQHSEIRRSLFYARVSALTDEEFQQLVSESFKLNNLIRGAVRSRLLREGRDDIATYNYDNLIANLLLEERRSNQFRRQINSLLSALYPLLSPNIRGELLAHWRDRATKDASNRWLKAVGSDRMFMSLEEVLSFWRETHNRKAIQVYLDNAAPRKIGQLLPEIIRNSDEGWIISRAVMKVSNPSDATWDEIAEKFPSTYLYLHAKLNLSLEAEKAADLVVRACRSESDNAGLAIWAIGVMKMWNVVIELESRVNELEDYVISSINFKPN